MSSWALMDLICVFKYLMFPGCLTKAAECSRAQPWSLFSRIEAFERLASVVTVGHVHAPPVRLQSALASSASPCGEFKRWPPNLRSQVYMGFKNNSSQSDSHSLFTTGSSEDSTTTRINIFKSTKLVKYVWYKCEALWTVPKNLSRSSTQLVTEQINILKTLTDTGTL